MQADRRIRRIKHTAGRLTEIKYEVSREDDWEKVSVESPIAPEPALPDALQTLVHDVMKICELEASCEEGLTIGGVLLSYNEDAVTAVITAKQRLSSGVVWNFKTPLKLVRSDKDGSSLSGFAQRIQGIEEEACRFLDGARGQAELPLDEKGEDSAQMSLHAALDSEEQKAAVIAYQEGFEAIEDAENPYVHTQFPPELQAAWRNGQNATWDGRPWQLDKNYPGDVIYQGMQAAAAGYPVEDNPYAAGPPGMAWSAGYEEWWKQHPGANPPTPTRKPFGNQEPGDANKKPAAKKKPAKKKAAKKKPT